MDIFQALILSIVEGISEFLPISSTGHLVLTADLLKIPQTEFVKSFEIIIQLGAILAVLTLYGRRLLVSIEVLKKVIIAFVPTGIIGLTLYRVVKDLLIGNSLVTVIALFLGGILLIILEKIYLEKPHHLEKIEHLSYKNAILIGLAQSVSIIPGVSRAGATIMGGMFLGLKRTTATEFSFLLAIPTMFAATGLDLMKNYEVILSSDPSILAVGLIGSFITALFSVKFLIQYVSKHNFIVFGVYRIILSIIFWLIFIA
jgi:undecaprenyl-diphosphatase